MSTAKTKKGTKSKKTGGESKQPAKPKAEKPENKLSALSAAARVLEETGEAMTCPELIATMAAKGYWSSLAGKTPAATLSAAMHREIKVRGAESRFKKWNVPGKFVAATVATGDGVKSASEEPDAASLTKKRTRGKTGATGKKNAKGNKAAENLKQSNVAKERALVEGGSVSPTASSIPDGVPGPESVAELFRL